MRVWVWLNNNLWYWLSNLNMYLIHKGIMWPHSMAALVEVRESDHMVDVYDEWKWERDHPNERICFDWSDPDAGYNPDWSRRNYEEDVRSL